MVVSPFVGVPSQSDGTKSKLSDISSSLLENRFFQNQILRQGASLAGPTLVAAGSAMQVSGDAPRTSFRSTKQTQRQGKKSAYKQTYRGRTYDKPLKRNMFGYKSPMGPDYGYRTDPKSKSGTKKGPAKSKTGRALKGVGRASGVIGLGLVAYNIHRHGAKKTAEDEIKFNYSISPMGVIDQQFFDGELSHNRYLNSAPGRTVSAIAQMAILEALL